MTLRTDCFRLSHEEIVLETPWGSAPGEILINGEPPGREWSVRCTAESPGTVRLEIENAADRPLELDAVHFCRWSPGVLGQDLECLSFRELVHGGSFQSLACGVKPVGKKTPVLDHVCPSSMFGVYQQNSGPALLLGAVPPVASSFTVITTLHSDLHLEGTFGFDVSHEFRRTLEPGESVCTWPMMALSGGNGVELMQRYGELWAERLENPASKPPVVGWNSWDYYSGAVDRAAMDENLDAAIDLFDGAVGVICIDEGWEQQWGRWQPNNKFPEGLEDFCGSVKARGARPGIWTAPLLVNTYSPLYLEHPQWFALNEEGQIASDTYSYGPMAYLDPTIPDVLEWLRELFLRLSAAGFTYYKVDFAHCILRAARFRDPSIARNDLIRRAFSTIRDAVGHEAYVLSCGSPYESVCGLVDSVRTTSDIHIYWGHVVKSAYNLSTRWWMTGKLWNCDPDFLVVRGPDTADPPHGKTTPIRPLDPGGGWTAGREFGEGEARSWALLAHLCGNETVLSDRLRSLRPVGVDILRRVLSPRTPPAVPVDLFTTEQPLPRIWISRGPDTALVGLFNWLDVPARIDFDPRRHGLCGTATDFWSGEAAGEGWLAPLGPRESRGLLFPLRPSE